MLPNYVYPIMLACALGACAMEDTETGGGNADTRCVCKPVMKMAWDPLTADHKVCNNETFDWLIHTMLMQVSTQKDALNENHLEISALKKTLEEKEGEISRIQEDRRYLDNENHKIWQEKEDMVRQKDHEIEDLKKRLADEKHVVSQLTKELRRVNDDYEKLEKEKKELFTELRKLEEQHVQVMKARPKDCAEIQKEGTHYSGIYTVYPTQTQEGIEVFCDLTTDNGGWLVIQRRQDGEQAFDRSWDTYKWGFGRLAKEFWLGNEYINQLTTQGNYELRIDLLDFDGRTGYARYDYFSITNEEEKYTLKLGDFLSGNIGDALTHHHNQAFSTKDVDNDLSNSGNCSQLFGFGGWWYVRCYDSNLNGRYLGRNASNKVGVVWYQWEKDHRSLKHSEMKIRPRNFGKPEYT